MKKEIDIQKRVFEKQQYEQIIETSFTQLTIQNQVNEVEREPQTVGEFFQLYTQLFYEIPKEGAINSHRFIIDQSTEYTGGAGISEEIQALQEEITDLREENLELQQQLLNLARTNG